MLELYQKDFIYSALESNALCFGRFELKSGRVSPYFFNVGAFHDGRALDALGRAYAAVVRDLRQELPFDVLFGPAYKGIPLVCAVSMGLYRQYRISLPWAFNRKEIKNHGEGGCVVGAPLNGKRVLIVDDVITAGTAVRESLALIRAQDAQAVGVVVALDRQEKVEDGVSAVTALETQEGLPVYHIINLTDLLDFVSRHEGFGVYRPAMQAYRQQWGV